MKKSILILLSVLSFGAFSQINDTTRTSSKIAQVSVFFSGAEVTREVNYAAKKGSQLLFIDQLPLGLNEQSLQVSEVKNGKILSVKHVVGFSKEKKDSSLSREKEDRIDMIHREMKTNRSKKSVYILEEDFILKNGKLGGSQGASIEEIKAGSDFYRLKLNEIKTSQLSLDIEFDQLKEELQELTHDLEALKMEKRKDYGQLYISLDHDQAMANAELKFSYYLEGAGWEPIYDFRVKEKGEPLWIDYKARIYQSSGEDWNEVNLTLSTGDPTLSNAKPNLESWYIDKKIRKKDETIIIGGSKNATLKGKLLDADSDEPVPFANIVLEVQGVMIGGTSSDFDGNYTIKPLPAGSYSLKASSVGFDPVLINRVDVYEGKITFQDVFMKSSDIDLQEVMIVEYAVPRIDNDYTVSSEAIAKMPNRSANAYSSTVGGVYSHDQERGSVRGARSEKTISYIDGVKVIGSAEYINTNYLIDEVEKKMSQIEYEIKSPFTVLSDGNDYTLKIKDSKVKVDYVYFVVPKLEEDVFLTAQVTDWNDLDLLTGLSSIYYQGTFTGESYIDDSYSGDTLDISLGRDRDIQVTRKGNKEKMERHVFGKYIKETLSWDIELKNNKNTMVALICEDQFPLAEDQSIEIELLEISDAKSDPKTGKLTWELELEPGAKKTLNITYTIKYPSYKTLYLD